MVLRCLFSRHRDTRSHTCRRKRPRSAPRSWMRSANPLLLQIGRLLFRGFYLAPPRIEGVFERLIACSWYASEGGNCLIRNVDHEDGTPMILLETSRRDGTPLEFFALQFPCGADDASETRSACFAELVSVGCIADESLCVPDGGVSAPAVAEGHHARAASDGTPTCPPRLCPSSAETCLQLSEKLHRQQTELGALYAEVQSFISENPDDFVGASAPATWSLSASCVSSFRCSS